MTDQQNDPWATVNPVFADVAMGVTERVYLADAVDAARAADAAQIASLRAERDLLKRGVATVTWGDADAVIAKLVAQRDAAQQEKTKAQEAQTLRKALAASRDAMDMPLPAPTEGVSPQPGSNSPVIPDSSVEPTPEPRGADSKTAP